jgi:transposase
MNYNLTLANENNILSSSNEQKLFSMFSTASFNKEDAAQVLGISVSGAYKLLQRMKEQKTLNVIKSGKQWVYNFKR